MPVNAVVQVNQLSTTSEEESEIVHVLQEHLPFYIQQLEVIDVDIGSIRLYFLCRAGLCSLLECLDSGQLQSDVNQFLKSPDRDVTVTFLWIRNFINACCKSSDYFVQYDLSSLAVTP